MSSLNRRKVLGSALAPTARPNVFIKLGGLIGRLIGSPLIDQDLPPTSEVSAATLKPYIETCVKAFGPGRSMFDSNFRPDTSGCSYRVLWNAFRQIVAGCSDSEKANLFAGTVIRAYRLPDDLGMDPAPRWGRTASPWVSAIAATAVAGGLLIVCGIPRSALCETELRRTRKRRLTT